MLRMKPIQSANRACLYYGKSDAGYYQGGGGLHCEWGGKGAPKLGLDGEPDYEHFKHLMHGLDPHTGEQLTAKLIEDRLSGWDVTASVPKGVTMALERGDTRIQAAIWEAVREAMAHARRLRHNPRAGGRPASRPGDGQPGLVCGRASRNPAGRR